MAAITYVAPSPVSPVGELNVRRGEATVDIDAGEAVVVDGAPSSARFETAYGLATDETEAIGIAITNATAGNTVEVMLIGFIGGFSGLTPDAPLSVVNGVLNNTAPAGASRRTIFAYNATTVAIF